MKITDVEVIILEAPGGNGTSTNDSCETCGFKYLAILRVSTDAEITGYSDLETQPQVARAIVEAAGEGLAPGFQGLRDTLLGEDPFEVERLWHIIGQCPHFCRL